MSQSHDCFVQIVFKDEGKHGFPPRDGQAFLLIKSVHWIDVG